uniref:Uncharacterized protein n=1 Tax=Anguilla anguilla TaxID=7936 RepID=A0A0E9PJC3_ANGAN
MRRLNHGRFSSGASYLTQCIPKCIHYYFPATSINIWARLF